MRAVQKWIADDGKMFDSEKDCKKYELDKKISDDALNQCRVWDGDFKPIKISKEHIGWVERVSWAYAPTETAREILNILCREGGYYEFFAGDTEHSTFIQWDDNKYGYVDMENVIAEMKKLMEDMKNA